METVHFVLREGTSKGRKTLSMGEDFHRYAAQDQDGAYDELGRQQLLKDEFVIYVGGLNVSEK